MVKRMKSPCPGPESASPAPAGASSDATRAFLVAVADAFDAGALHSLVLAKVRHGGGDLHAVRVRRIGLRGAAALSLVYAHATRDVTRNLSRDEALAAVAALLDPAGAPSFGHATLRTAESETQLLVSKKGRATLRRSPPVPRPDATAADSALPAHDRARARRLPLELAFLRELGITDERQRVVPAQAKKWRQIDKFLEVLDHALADLPGATTAAWHAPGRIRVVDFGCGKGLLTFAVHEHLRRRFGGAPEVIGVELRAELVASCNEVAGRCGCTGLSFVAGDLRTFAPAAVDIMIALHACDTATDHAIDLGVRAGAAVLVCSPCCHKELRPQMTRPRLLSGLLRHGIHLGQEAEMVTDSLRALLLETCGYEARVFEFVALEHTSKNKMILAKRRAGAAAQAARARAEVDELKSFYGIREQCLETLLRRRAAAADSPQACQTP
jgi:SAM-dependent methyltransferase